MRRADMYKNINRNTRHSSSNSAPQRILTSDMYTEPIWMPDEEPNRPSGVHIVELSSSGSEKSIKDNKTKDQWDRSSGSQTGNQEYFNINKAAREKRRKLIEESHCQRKSYFGEDTTEFQEDYLYGNFIVSGTSDMDNENVIYNQINCFTIYDDQAYSDNFEDDYEGIELVQCEELAPDWNPDVTPDRHVKPTCDADFLGYDPDTEDDKRTVWIYSFKNKHLLTDNDYELVNIPGEDDSSSSSFMKIEELNETKVVQPKPTRVPSPAPPCMIPKLNLINLTKTPTLPTVAEDFESKLSFTCPVDKFKSKKRIILKENNWFSEHATPTSGGDTVDKSSVLNWMALSPREKKRRFRHASPLSISHELNIMPTVKEASLMVNQNDFQQKETRGCGDSIKEIDTSIKGHETVKESHDQSTNTEYNFYSDKAVLDQVHTAIAGSAKHTAKSSRSNVSSVGSLATVRETIITGSVKKTCDIIRQRTDSNEILVTESKISHRENAYEDKKVSPDAGSGDYYKNRKVPRISIPSLKISTGHTENLESDNWIHEETLIHDDRIRMPTDGKGDRASDALWLRNMALLKPAEWSEYLGIAESIPSLHLSMNTESVVESDSWFRRIANFFRCCK